LKHTLFLLAVIIVLAACATAPVPTPIPAGPVAQNQPGQNQAAGQSQSSEPKFADRKEFTDSDPLLIKKTGRPQMVMFFAHWCTTCHSMRQMIFELQDAYNSRIDFLYMNIDAENTKGPQKDLNFTGLRPTLVFLTPGGEEMGRLLGVQSREDITKQLDSLVTGG